MGEKSIKKHDPTTGGVLSFYKFPLQIVKRVKEPFDGDGWLFEIKHDGFRVLAIRNGGSTRLFSRNGHDISRQHRHITGPLNDLPADRFVIDGELVVLDNDGRSNFAKLAHGRTGTHYYAFDILLLDADDLRDSRLETRKAILKVLLGECDPVRYTDHVIGTGVAFFGLVKRAGLEGMVAKRRASTYSGVLTDDWLKVKCLRVHDFVVGGLITGEDGQTFSALLPGEFIDGELRYVGTVESGFNRGAMRAIARLVRTITTSPFKDSIPEIAVRFCEPRLRIGVEFLDLTEDGYLRHPNFRRFSDALLRHIEAEH